MFVIKADGTKERFQKSKIAITCIRAGVSKEDAEETADKIAKTVKNGTRTREIYKMILSLLDKIERSHKLVFQLREAIAQIPSDLFETYAKKVLQAHGYECRGSTIIKGKCVGHEVDVIAKKDKLFMVECKHHVNPHRFCGLGIALQVQARLEDIQDGFAAGTNRYNFDYAWLFNNTKFSDHARIYADAKNIRLTGWRTNGFSLDSLIHAKSIFPVTILGIPDVVMKSLFENKILTLQDIVAREREIAKIMKKKDYAESMAEEAKKLIS